MSENIFIAVAWPYANGSLHIGQIAGAYLSPDIFARYHRMVGNNVLMVSGSDAHGTPVTITAESKSVSPLEIVRHFQEEFSQCWSDLGISFDLFTSTTTCNHTQIVHDIFLQLYNKGYIYLDIMRQPFCENDNRFLADRYVEGQCPFCSFESARGDQCDNCGRTLDPADLKNLSCKLCDSTPIFKDTEHFFFRLSAFQNQLLDWVSKQDHWKPNVRNFTASYIANGLRDRAITRDIGWGVTIPISGYEHKRIYVWFEAVIGYLSASIEWSKSIGDPDQWETFWKKESRSYYFMGKDNIPFHTVIWPAILMAYGGLRLPYDVPANEYVNLNDKKASTSGNWAVWLPDYLARYEPDPMRYVLSAIMPETSDSDFSWAEYVRRNNDELVATYGNLVHRSLTLTVNNFHSRVPTPATLGEADKTLLATAKYHFQQVGKNIEECHFRQALLTIMKLAQESNKYLNIKAPWHDISNNRAGAATTLWTCLTVINCLKTAFYPFMPSSSDKLHNMLGLPGKIADVGWSWDPEALQPGYLLPQPKPLFQKFDQTLIAEETHRIGR